MSKIVTDEFSGRDIELHEHKSFHVYESIEDFALARPGVLQAIRYRATVDALLHFANRVRELGGADFIDKLMPSTPDNAESCLIANALNFNSQIMGHKGVWSMHVANLELAEEISDGMDLAVYHEFDDEIYRGSAITLPEEIGLVALAFDSNHDVELMQFSR
jgi:hypothetical protein